MITAILFGGFGLIAGSFLNVFVGRHGVRPLTGRSACDACGAVIAWYDLIPVLSWFILGARCRACKVHVSVSYPLVEAATAALFLSIGLSPLALESKLLALPIAFLLFAIALYDLRTTYIPNAWVWTFNAFALISIFLIPYAIPHTPYAILAGPLVASPLFGLWAISRGKWMGFGDVKFALGMGWLLGLVSGFAALLLSFIIGAFISLPLLWLTSDAWRRARDKFMPSAASFEPQKRYTMKSEIAFGPFLVLACVIVWVLDIYSIEIPLLPLVDLSGY